MNFNREEFDYEEYRDKFKSLFDSK